MKEHATKHHTLIIGEQVLCLGLPTLKDPKISNSLSMKAKICGIRPPKLISNKTPKLPGPSYLATIWVIKPNWGKDYITVSIKFLSK